MAGESYRVMHKFWLDLTKDEEFAIDERIANLKHQRSFAKTIRDGIRLICDLRNGNVDVLFELFPWIEDRLKVGHSNESSNGNTDEIQTSIARLEQLLLQNQLPSGNVSMAVRPSALQSGSTPKAMNVPRFDMPTFDDDDDLETIVLKKSTSTDSVENFKRALMGLTQ